MKSIAVAALAASAVTLCGSAFAADPRHPDWPCHQIEVPQLSIAAFWTGPSIDDVGDSWTKDQAVNDLVQRLAARRTPLADAEKAAADYIEGSSDEKRQKAKLLFAGLFSTLNAERTQVMDGIERFSERQQQLRAKITADLNSMRTQQDATNPDAAAVDKLGNQLAWDTRVFDDRRHTITYVCDVPSTIERRLFSLARAIQQKLD